MATTNPLLGWSELVPDLLSLVYKRLSLADFARARTVCSSWYSVSRSSSPRKNNIPWLIFKQDKEWQLFNPEEGTFYRTQINQLGFADWHSLATCGNWVLVTDDKAYLYIINPFTLEIIYLPTLIPTIKSNSTSVDKVLDNYSIHFDYGFRKGQRHGHEQSVQVVRVESAVLWVDERSKDYLVVWTSRRSRHICFCRNGDEEWIKKPCEYLGTGQEDEDMGVDMAYKDSKLYILTGYGRIRILDFSQEFPIDVPNQPYFNRLINNNHCGRMRLKLTTSGNVLIIRQKLRWGLDETTRFKVFKMNSTSEEWKRVDSLEEEEALVWDLSVALPTKGVSGIKKDSLYFCDYYTSPMLKATTYEIPTDRMERFEQCSHFLGVGDARWFLPCFSVGE